MLRRAQRVVTAGFLALLALLAVVAATAYLGVNRIRSEIMAEHGTRETAERLRELRLRLTLADSALGVSIGGRDTALSPLYQTSVRAQLALLDSLERQPADSAIATRLRALRAAVTFDHAEVERARATPGGLGRLQRPRYIQPRRMIIALEGEEDRRGRERERRINASAARTWWVVLGAALIAMGAVGIVLAETRRVLRAAGASQQALDLHRSELEVRVAERTAELAESTARLRESEEHYRQVVEELPHLVWTCEPDGRCSFLSRQWVEYTGIPEAEQLGSGWMERIHPEDRAHMMEQWTRSVSSGAPMVVDFRIRRHDGEYRWFDTRAVPLRRADGTIVRWFGSNTDVEDVRSARRSLDRERERLARIAAVSPAVLHSFRVGPDGKMSFPFAAPRIADIYGLAASDLTEDAGPALGLIHPEDAPRIEATIRESADGMTPWHQRWRIRHPSRGEVWVEGYSSPVPDADGGINWHGVLMDVTGLVATDMAMARQARLLAISFDAILVWDFRGGIEFWNAGAEELYGFSAEEATGKMSDALLQTRQVSEGPRFREVLESTTRWAGLLEHRSKAGETMVVESRMQLVQDGERSLVFESNRDVTTRLRTEQELRRSNRELEQFAYAASHDLREPLRAVSGCVQILGSQYGGALDARADELIRHAVEGAARMQRLIDDLLAFSRLSTRPSRPEPIAAEKALAAALQNLTTSIRESGAAIDAGPLPTVRADRGQLTSLFQNLIGNALTFRRETPRVVIRAVPQDGAWLFSVRDNGIGIERQYFDRIFGVFQRLHTREEYPGTGMGLALCQKIVEQAGGRIWLDSIPGEGTTFFFTLPQDPSLSRDG